MNAKKADGKKCKGCFLGLRCIKNKSGGLERNWFLCLLLSDLTKRNQSASTSTQQLWGREAQQNWRGIVRVNSKAIEVWAIMHWYNSPMWGILMWTSGMEDVIWKNKQGEEERAAPVADGGFRLYIYWLQNCSDGKNERSDWVVNPFSVRHKRRVMWPGIRMEKTHDLDSGHRARFCATRVLFGLEIEVLFKH